VSAEGEAASDEPDLDALLNELGGDAPASEAPKADTPAEEIDLDALLAELGDDEKSDASPAAEAAEPAKESAASDLDALLADLQGSQAAEAAVEAPAPETNAAPSEPAPKTSAAAAAFEAPKPAPAPPPARSAPLPPVRAFDRAPEEEESQPSGPGWSRFSKSGYGSGKKSPGTERPKPWKKSGAAPGGDAQPGSEGEGKAGWGKLKPDAPRDDDDPPGPTAGWDKFRR